MCFHVVDDVLISTPFYMIDVTAIWFMAKWSAPVYLGLHMLSGIQCRVDETT